MTTVSITISFDDRDTPAIASEKKRNYLKATGRPFPETTWRFLTGDKKNIAEFTRAVGFTFREEKNGFSHPRALIFLSPGGTVSRYLYGMSFSPFDIRMALKEASAGSSFFSAERLSLFCYHYDPGENRYVFNLARSLAAVLFMVDNILFRGLSDGPQKEAGKDDLCRRPDCDISEFLSLKRKIQRHPLLGPLDRP